MSATNEKSAKHTPGPWFAVQHGDPQWRIAVGSQQSLQTVAVTSQSNDEANARLLAVAPELLEALVGLVWLATPHFSDKTQLEHLVLCERLIKKASGESGRE